MAFTLRREQTRYLSHQRKESAGSREIAMAGMTGIVSSNRVSIIRRYRAIWSHFVHGVIAGRTRRVGDEIAEHLERHRYELTPEVRIELERRYIGSYD
jgi:hypothetical protein